MSLNKQKMVREIGRRTRLKNRDIQAMLEALVEVWTEELVSDGRIELENFLVLEVREIDRGGKSGQINTRKAPQKIKRVLVRISRSIRNQLKCR